MKNTTEISAALRLETILSNAVIYLKNSNELIKFIKDLPANELNDLDALVIRKQYEEKENAVFWNLYYNIHLIINNQLTLTSNL